MKRFRVAGKAMITLYVDVEAETAEEAERLAAEAPVAALPEDFPDPDGQWSLVGDVDGRPDPGTFDTHELD